ncbi:MAG TPA: hypothetical protein VJ841_01335 [Candidatus Saccharimonadales bacterium]|nr:hypothetical protein [Candidatus Saccharimonadales bacterium]
MGLLIISGDLTENRSPIARMKIRNMATLTHTQDRITEVDSILRVHRRSLMVGVAAVSIAVNDTGGEDVG